MKRKLLFSLSLMLGLTAFGQTTVGDIFEAAKERVKISGYGQAGYTYSQEKGGPGSESTFDLKRANITISAQITDKWTATFTPEFKGGKVLELYTDYAVIPAVKFKAGQFKTPFSIENKYSASVIPVISCGSAAMRYLLGTDGSDPMNLGSGGRDLGVMMYGDLYFGMINYEIAVMNGNGIEVKDRNKDKDLVGRLTLNGGDNLAISGSFIIGRGNALVANTDLDIVANQNYKRNRWAVGADYKSKIIDVRFEYLAGKDHKTRSQGAYVTSLYHICPKVDLVGSIDMFKQNTAITTKEWNYTGGLQYWFHKKCRLQAQYVFTDNHKGANKSALVAQLQVGF